ncbi:hypothetical protein Fcan01_28335 [Folsomia candida]|uniref:Uncharacterized protein n=1 Tax=Folsomia candida TaxID=158441 RepID=A0A226CTW8_FOLCA|nr:hypothetical protein Fcan01_28335 [Folsomia candida]
MPNFVRLTHLSLSARFAPVKPLFYFQAPIIPDERPIFGCQASPWQTPREPCIIYDMIPNLVMAMLNISLRRHPWDQNQICGVLDLHSQPLFNANKILMGINSYRYVADARDQFRYCKFKEFSDTARHLNFAAWVAPFNWIVWVSGRQTKLKGVISIAMIATLVFYETFFTSMFVVPIHTENNPGFADLLKSGYRMAYFEQANNTSVVDDYFKYYEYYEYDFKQLGIYEWIKDSKYFFLVKRNESLDRLVTNQTLKVMTVSGNPDYRDNGFDPVLESLA